MLNHENLTRSKTPSRNRASESAAPKVDTACFPGLGEQGASTKEKLFRAKFTVARQGPKTPEIKLQLTWGSQSFVVTLEIEGNPVFEGSWETSLTRDGEPLGPVEAWELVCRHHSPEVGYVEAVQLWKGGLKLWRHILVARKDTAVLLGEAVTGGRPEDQWIYSTQWTVAPAVQWKGSRSTTDGWLLLGRKKTTRLLPIFSPEWKDEGQSCKIAKKGEHLRLGAEFRGRGFFVPIFLDCLPRRFTHRCTWRQLTIAENQQPVPEDLAAAYRIQVGDAHWLLYRTLGPPGKRSFFGHQLVSELLFARFDRQTGTVNPLLELVEVPE